MDMKINHLIAPNWAIRASHLDGYLPSKNGARFNNHIFGYHLAKVRDDPWFWTTKAIYLFTLVRENPLTYINGNSDYWIPGERYETDMGSVPVTAQVIVPKDRGLLSYLFHDYACLTGHLHKRDTYGVYHEVKLTRKQRDDMLLEMLAAEGVNKFQRYLVWYNVRLFGIVTGQG